MGDRSKSKSVALFQEATDRAIQLTESPVALFNPIWESSLQIVAISGLENLPKIDRNSDLPVELSGLEFCDRATIDSDGSFFIDDCEKDESLRQSSLYQLHGIRSYLGVPVLTTAGDPIGTISILDFTPRQFTKRDISSLQTIGKWIGSEFDRQNLVRDRVQEWSLASTICGVDDEVAAWEHSHNKDTISTLSTDKLEFELLNYLSQEFCNPLTSILGMARVLQQEIYGPLSLKQKSYLDVIRNSGLQLTQLVDEIANLSHLYRHQNYLSLKPVDIEMLCQSVIQNLDALSKQKDLSIELDILLDRRIWLLDRDKLKSILYYAISSLIQAMSTLNTALPSDNPTLTVQISTSKERLEIHLYSKDIQMILPSMAGLRDRQTTTITSKSISPTTRTNNAQMRMLCGLSLSQALVNIHGGKMEVNGDRSGYNLYLPLMIAENYHN
jgi:signal transduction histidine kinase